MADEDPFEEMQEKLNEAASNADKVEKEARQDVNEIENSYYDVDRPSSRGGGNHECDYCGRTFATIDDLKQHRQDEHWHEEGVDTEGVDYDQPQPTPEQREAQELHEAQMNVAKPGYREGIGRRLNRRINKTKLFGSVVGLIFVSLLFIYVAEAMLVLISIVGLWGFYAGFSPDNYSAFHDVEALFMATIFVLTGSNAVLSILAGRFMELSVLAYLFTAVGTGIYLFVGGHYENVKHGLEFFEPHGKESPLLILIAQIVLIMMVFLGGGLIGIPILTGSQFFTAAAIIVGVLSPLSLFIMFKPEYQYAQRAKAAAHRGARQAGRDAMNAPAKARNFRSKGTVRDTCRELMQYIEEQPWGTDQMKQLAWGVSKRADKGQIDNAHHALDDLSRMTPNDQQVNELVGTLRNELNGMVEERY